MKTPSELLDQLAQKAKEAEGSANAVKEKNRAGLEAKRSAIEAKLEADEAKLDAASKDAGSKLEEMQRDLQTSFAAKRSSIKAEIAEQKVARDVKRAAKRADHAELDAEFAVDFALAAIEQAEYAVINAVLARADSDDLSETAS